MRRGPLRAAVHDTGEIGGFLLEGSARRAKRMPSFIRAAADLIMFAIVADISILTLNLSLMINTVSFYQVRGCWAVRICGWGRSGGKAPRSAGSHFPDALCLFRGGPRPRRDMARAARGYGRTCWG